MSTTSLISATTATDSGTFDCTGPATIVITANKLQGGEVITVKAEDASGSYTDELHRFMANSRPSCLIDTYRSVKVEKTATKESVGAGYGA